MKTSNKKMVRPMRQKKAKAKGLDEQALSKSGKYVFDRAQYLAYVI